VNTLAQYLWLNPEFIRNVRAQLRLKRLLIAGIVSGIVSLVIIPAMVPHRTSGPSPADEWAYTRWVLGVQSFVLNIGGGIACLQSIGREKEQNTFDYQRITRLSPFELTLGKLFGAPAKSWFVALCFVPAAVRCCVRSCMNLSFTPRRLPYSSPLRARSRRARPPFNASSRPHASGRWTPPAGTKQAACG
jgi:hypothetical protein